MSKEQTMAILEYLVAWDEALVAFSDGMGDFARLIVDACPQDPAWRSRMDGALRAFKAARRQMARLKPPPPATKDFHERTCRMLRLCAAYQAAHVAGLTTGDQRKMVDAATAHSQAMAIYAGLQAEVNEIQAAFAAYQKRAVANQPRRPAVQLDD